MAKVTGPLMSMDASGAFAGTLVFTRWKGRPVVRQLVIPSNPRSTDQAIQRNILRVTAAAQRWANVSTSIGPGRTKKDKEVLIDYAPAGFAWNGNFVKTMVGLGSVAYNAATAAFATLGASDKTAWDTAAAALTPAITSVVQRNAFTNEIGTPISAGNVWFVYQYALFLLTIRTVPGATPPTYT